jgi:hypothetical protein
VLLCWSLIQAIIVPPDEQPPQKKTDAPEHGSFATTGESADTAAISSVADSVSTLARSMN